MAERGLTEDVASSGPPGGRGAGTPLLVVIVGPTGSGKSTLINSLAQRNLSPVGAKRPTSDRLTIWAQTPGFDADTSPMAGLPVDTVQGEDPLLRKLAIVDTPDLDSDVVEHRDLALLAAAAAECLVFVVSPIRYADAALWAAVNVVAGSRKPMVFVLNRTTPESSAASGGLSAMLGERLRGVPPLIEIPQLRPARAILPAPLVAGLRSQLQGWGRRAAAIRRVVALAKSDGFDA
jgi:hypothetical protein